MIDLMEVLPEPLFPISSTFFFILHYSTLVSASKIGKEKRNGEREGEKIKTHTSVIRTILIIIIIIIIIALTDHNHNHNHDHDHNKNYRNNNNYCYQIILSILSILFSDCALMTHHDVII